MTKKKGEIYHQHIHETNNYLKKYFNFNPNPKSRTPLYFMSSMFVFNDKYKNKKMIRYLRILTIH